MSNPVVQKTWTITANNQIVFTSLVQTQGTFLKGVADFLLAHGYTCKGSSNGVAAAMDGVNRWAAVADASVRGATTTNAQSWMVLIDGNGCNICLAYTGNADEKARVAFSTSGVYVAAGTATFTPTATDEVVALANDTINSTASLDRWWFGWVDSQSKLCRFLVCRNGVLVGSPFGIELVQSRVTVTWSPTVVGWSQPAGGFLYAYGASAMLDNGPVGAAFIKAAATVTLRTGTMLWSTGSFMTWTDVITENQGSVGYQIAGPLSLGSTATPRSGPLCTYFDLWGTARTGAVGDTWNSKAFVTFNAIRGILLPWDGSTTPNVGGGAPGTQTGQAFGFENPSTDSYGLWLDGTSMYLPLANSGVTPTGPSTPTSIDRRPGVELIRLNQMTADPPTDSAHGQLYFRTIGGQQALFMRYPDGTIYQVGAG